MVRSAKAQLLKLSLRKKVEEPAFGLIPTPTPMYGAMLSEPQSNLDSNCRCHLQGGSGKLQIFCESQVLPIGLSGCLRPVSTAVRRVPATQTWPKTQSGALATLHPFQNWAE